MGILTHPANAAAHPLPYHQVHDMLDRTWSELMLYERVVKNWPLFGPHLEAALCDVLRTVQGSLNRICAGASNTAMTQQPGACCCDGAVELLICNGRRAAAVSCCRVLRH